MKKLNLLILMSALSLVLFAPKAKAQIDVKANILGAIFNDYGIGGEYLLNEELSAGLNVSYSVWKVSFGTTAADEWKYTGFKLIPNFRFYFNPDDDCEGYYAEIYFKYRNLKSKGNSMTFWEDTNGDGIDDAYVDHPYTTTNNGLAAGIAFGRKWVTNSGFFFETLGGIGKYLTSKTKYDDPKVQTYYDDPNNFSLNWTGLDFRLGLVIGWRFQ